MSRDPVQIITVHHEYFRLFKDRQVEVKMNEKKRVQEYHMVQGEPYGTLVTIKLSALLCCMTAGCTD